MNNFGTIFLYECKKVFLKKMVLISSLLCILTIVFSLTVPFQGDYYVDGVKLDSNLNMYLKDKAYAEALDGRIIDQALIEKTVDAYRKIPQDPDRHYIVTEEYQTFARPYSEIFNIIRSYLNLPTSEVMYSWEPSETEVYESRRANLEKDWENLRLSDGEKQFWRAQEEKIVAPVTYRKTHSYNEILSVLQTVGLAVLMIISICLSGIFSGEHQRNTDSILLCAKNGRLRLYLAKIAAATAFSAAAATLFFAAALLTVLIFYGADDPDASFQLIYSHCSDPITCAEAVAIMFVSLLAAAIVTGILCAVLSEVFQNGVAVIAVMTALFILPMFVSIPAQYRIAAQIWNWLPFGFVSPWNIFDSYTLPIFGVHLTPWQSVPILYAIMCGVIAGAGMAVYRRAQVKGR